MNRNAFDELAMELGAGHLTRRRLIGRALKLSAGGIAFGATGASLPMFAKQVAASQSPLDPPPGWPDYLPWPWGPGPTFPIFVSRSILRDAGVQWYIGSAGDTGDGKISGLSKKGDVVRQYEFSQSGASGLEFSMSEGKTNFEGSISFEALADGGIRMAGKFDGRSFEGFGDRSGSFEAKKSFSLDPAKAALLAQFSRIGEPIHHTGRSLVGEPSVPQASCTGCVISLGGLGVWGAGCCLSTAVGLALVCGGSWLAATGTWVDNCDGACHSDD